jgi:phosphoglycerol transferase MdoB-like AlkP superfamily enzyme
MSRVGPYVGDGAVGSRLLSELKRSAEVGRPLYGYAVTMEAHDPYRPGRVAGIDDPILQYMHHAENLDRMLANLAAIVDRAYSRVLLVVFGDHVPMLPAPYWPFEDSRTDFFAVELGRDALPRRVDIPVTKPEDINALIRFCVTTATATLDPSVI